MRRGNHKARMISTAFARATFASSVCAIAFSSFAGACGGSSSANLGGGSGHDTDTITTDGGGAEGGNTSSFANEPDAASQASTPDALSIKGTRVYNGTAVSTSFGDPSSSKIWCWIDDTDALQVLAQNADWEVSLSLELDPSFQAPATLTLSTFPSSVGNAALVTNWNSMSGAGNANEYVMTSSAFQVVVSDYSPTHIKGSFSGGVATSDGIDTFQVSAASFDLNIGAAPPPGTPGAN